MDTFPDITGVNYRSLRKALKIVKYLTIRNGKLLRNGDRVTIECGNGSGGGGRWTGAVWFANTLMHDYSEDTGWPADILTGRYLACHLITGASRFIDELTDADDDNEQVHQVATRTLVSEDPDVYEYALSNNTQGDIIIRVT
jgi:hypothetical protein